MKYDDVMEGIVCPKCYEKTKVIRTTASENGVIVRRRQCISCGYRLSSEERVLEIGGHGK